MTVATTKALYETLYTRLSSYLPQINKVPNGGYESAITGTSALGSATVERSSTYAAVGSYAAKLTTPATWGTTPGIAIRDTDDSRLSVDASISHTFSLLIYAVGGSIGWNTQPTLVWYNAAGLTISSASDAVQLAAGWNSLSVTATSPATAASVDLRLLVNSPLGIASAWIDDVRLMAISGDTLDASLTGGLWVASPPEDAWDKYPFGVMRLVNRQTGGEYDGIRETADLEVLLYHRGVTNRHALESLADTCDEAMLGWFINSGPAFSGARQRDTFEQPSPPAQRDVVVVRLVYQLVVWPGWLTKYSL